MDVECLYSNIQHHLGLKATKHYLYTKSLNFFEHNDFVTTILEFLLTHNYFIFDNTYYLQKKGTAMGTTCAPHYANLFLGWWEHEYVFTDHMNKYTEHILFWGRFIDDDLIFWEGDEHLFHEFVQQLNRNDIEMFFTSEINKHEITFLDLKILNDQGGCIQTEIYRKPTSTNGFLQWGSYHPTPLKRGIPTGQYLRARRNCSNEEAFEIECNNLYQRFVDRGYPKKHLKRAYWRAKHSEREELLKESTNNRVQSELIIRCIGTFDGHNPEVVGILKRHWPILMTDSDL